MTTTKNGTTLPTNGKKVETTVQVAAPKKEETKVIPLNPSPIENKLSELNKLFDLQKKHSLLLKSKEKLNEFSQTQGEENIKLTLSDEENRKVVDFETTNPELIAAVVSCIQSTIENKRAVIESQLLAA